MCGRTRATAPDPVIEAATRALGPGRPACLARAGGSAHSCLMCGSMSAAPGRPAYARARRATARASGCGGPRPRHRRLNARASEPHVASAAEREGMHVTGTKPRVVFDTRIDTADRPERSQPQRLTGERLECGQHRRPAPRGTAQSPAPQVAVSPKSTFLPASALGSLLQVYRGQPAHQLIGALYGELEQLAGVSRREPEMERPDG